jgi:hypothetical protein
MNHFSTCRFSTTTPLIICASIAALVLSFAATAEALSPTPKNLGNGLAQVVARDMALKRGAQVTAPGTGSAVDLGNRAIRDKQGRILVTIMLKNKSFRQTAIAVPGVQKVAEDMKYKGGAIEAFVPAEQVAALARRRGVSAVFLSLAPFLDVGTTTSQGVVQHRVDQITNQSVSPVTGTTGAGVTVGVLSDTFDSAVTDATGAPKLTNAADDVASGDLPGPGNPNNSTPVLVLQEGDGASGTDEGRGMCQIIHDMAPKANIAFATAGPGQVGFGNNIRQLANSVANGGAGAQVIVDDVIFLDESMFEDGIVARAVDDVAAQGVAYFSSAGNRPATQGYFSDFRPVPNNANALANTNINLTGVPANLYAGGFHDFNPAPGLSGQDIAQTVNLSTAQFSFQWDDPFDVNPPTLGAQIPTTPPSPGPGSTTGTSEFEFTFVNDTLNKRVQIEVVGTAPTPNYDAIVKVINPDGTVLTDQDTGLAETVLVFLPQVGTYKVRVRQFAPATSGSFNYTVHNASGTPLVSTDFNILFFKQSDGTFVGAGADNNLATNRPVEVAQVTNGQAGGTGQVQVVLARSNVPPGGLSQPTKVRYVTFSSGSPQEYFTYNNTPITYGHNSAAGGNGVAAYAFYPPHIPEGFTSPGHAYIAFDKNNNRLAQPQFRLKPDMAAMDGANNTFFPGAAGDAAQDADSFPNFFGTSAAAPHAAAIAALVLEAKGGPGTVTPTQMRTMLQRSAFPHDLDPHLARVIARTGNSRLTITAQGDTGSTANITSTIDVNAFDVSYTGPNSLTQVIFNPQGTAATGGNTTEPTDTTSGFTSTPGIVFDNRAPNVGFPFTLGRLRGVAGGDIGSSLSNQAPPPAVVGNHFFTLTVNIASGALIGGEGFGFGIDRDEADAFGPAASIGGNSADLLGTNVRIPQGTLAPGGMTISGLTSTGGTFSGVFVNRIGAGYAVNDGFGFINAQSAVSQPLP